MVSGSSPSAPALVKSAPAMLSTSDSARAFIASYTTDGYAAYVAACKVAGLPHPDDAVGLVSELSSLEITDIQQLDYLAASLPVSSDANFFVLAQMGRGPAAEIFRRHLVSLTRSLHWIFQCCNRWILLCLSLLLIWLISQSP